MNESYKLKGGEKEYDKFINALKVAEAKAEDENKTITVQKKVMNSLEDVTKVHPSGKREDIE